MNYTCNAPDVFVGYIDRDVKTSRKPECLHQKESVADAQADRSMIWEQTSKLTSREGSQSDS